MNGRYEVKDETTGQVRETAESWSEAVNVASFWRMTVKHPHKVQLSVSARLADLHAVGAR